MNELRNIAFDSISELNLKRSFLHCLKDTVKSSDLVFYIDDIFIGTDSWEKQFEFLKDEFMPQLLWACLSLSFAKIWIEVQKMLALREIHEIQERVSLKSEHIQKILKWSTSQNVTEVHSFLRTVITTQKWVKEFAEHAHSLQHLTEKMSWRWEKVEQLSFNLMQNLCATAAKLYEWDLTLEVKMYVNASKFVCEEYICQLQKRVYVLIFYDSFTFTATERQYDTLKWELRAMVVFVTKHCHML